MELITILSIIATDAATVAIAFYTRKTHSLMEAGKKIQSINSKSKTFSRP